MTVLSVAVLQCPAVLDPSRERLDWLHDQLDLVGRRQDEPLPDLVVLPELFQCGYRSSAAMVDLAEPADGPFSAAIAELAMTFDTAIVYGFCERDGDSLFNSAQCINAAGRTIGHHRKLLLPPGFEAEHFTPGTQCDLFELGGFRMAILVCYDVEFPETVRHVALSGADLIVVPTALTAQWEVVAERVVPARAFENGLFLCYANYCGEDDGQEFLGSSCIIDPIGRDIARAGGQPGISVALLDRSAVEAARVRLPYHQDCRRLALEG